MIIIIITYGRDNTSVRDITLSDVFVPTEGISLSAGTLARCV
jgi:hypothetical protein